MLLLWKKQKQKKQTPSVEEEEEEMGKKVARKNQSEGGGVNDDALLRDYLLKDQSVNKSPSPTAKDDNTQASKELIEVDVVEYGSFQIGNSTRRSQRLQKATPSGQDLGIQRDLGHVGRGNDGALLIDLLSNDQTVNKSPSSREKDGTSDALKQLVDAAVVENGSLQIEKSTCRSQRLQITASSVQDLDIQSDFGHVEVVLEGSEGNGAEAEQDFRQSPDVEQKQSEQIERLSKLVEEQQRKIDQLAAGKSFSLQDVISLADSRRKEKTNKYKDMYVDAQEKINHMQEEKYELAKKVECANARLEGYELGQQSICGVIDKLKDAFLYASLSKPTELPKLPSTGNGSSTLKRSTQRTPQAAKRKNASSAVELLAETRSQATKRKRRASIKGK